MILVKYGNDTETTHISVACIDSWSARGFLDMINSAQLEKPYWQRAEKIENFKKYSITPKYAYTIDKLQFLLDRDIQKILREIDSVDLAKALKGCNEQVQSKIFDNMSTRAATMLKEDMEYMGPVSIEENSLAQERIVAVLEHLIDTGEITILDSKQVIK